MMLIDITEYTRPRGASEVRQYEVSDDLADNYKLMQKAGLNIACEELPVGCVALTLEDRNREEDILYGLAGTSFKAQYTVEGFLEWCSEDNPEFCKLLGVA
jgi:hypothetical protein